MSLTVPLSVTAPAASLLLLTACAGGAPAGTGGLDSPGAATTRGPRTAAAAPAVTVPTPVRDAFAVCSSAVVAKDAAGLSYCRSTAHTIPAGASSLACLANLASVPAATARLKVTYSVYTGGRNVAYFRDIAPQRYTIKGFQVRYDFTPQDARWRGMTTLPPGSYYCEWYDAGLAKLGEADLVHGTLPSSSVGTPGAPV